ncbi:MAG: TlpA disulfide reductase family protein [Flavobacteriaceae bacterium]
MKYKICIVVLTILFLCSCKLTGKDALLLGNIQSDVIETPLTEQLYEDLEGNQILLTNYKGKRILLNFWATWCKPCIEEMPALLRSKNILDKENYIFLLASDQSVEKIKAFKEKHNLDFNFIRFTGSLSQLRIYALPTTFIYNESGEKVDEISGAALWDSQQMIDKLKNIK